MLVGWTVLCPDTDNQSTATYFIIRFLLNPELNDALVEAWTINYGGERRSHVEGLLGFIT